MNWVTEAPDTILVWFFRIMLALTFGGGVADVTGYFDPPPNSVAEYERPRTIEPHTVSPPTDDSRAIPYKPGMVPVTDLEADEPRSLPTGEAAPELSVGTMKLSFERSKTGVPYLLGVGDIGTGTAEMVKRLDQKHNEEARYFIIHSLGGWVHEAVELARHFRGRELKVIVPDRAHCLSACTLALTGGTERVVYPTAWVGLHQVTLASRKSRPVRSTYRKAQHDTAQMMVFLETMGIDPMVWRWALQTPPDEMYMIAPSDLLKSRLATIVSNNIRMR